VTIRAFDRADSRLVLAASRAAGVAAALNPVARDSKAGDIIVVTTLLVSNSEAREHKDDGGDGTAG
jgi:hypothetical protein